MYHSQDEQAAVCAGCIDRTEDSARLQDRLIGALIGLAHAVVGNEEMINEQTHQLVRDVLISTMPDAVLAIEDGRYMLNRIVWEKQRLVPRCSRCDHPCGRNDDYDMSLMWNAAEEIRTLKTRLLLDLREMAVMAERSASPGHAYAAADEYLLHGLDVLGNEWDAESLRSIVTKAAQIKVRCAEQLMQGSIRTNRPKVAFVCVHNSCRSQIAEALGKHLASDVFESYSAGTEIKPQINQDAVRLMKEIYGIDMEKTQYSKLLTDIPPVDVVITMGCNVNCPVLPCKERYDWGLDDPTGQGDEAFREVIDRIREKVLALRSHLVS